MAWIWGPLPYSLISAIREGSNSIGIATYLKNGRWQSSNLWEYVPFTYKPYTRFSPDSWIKNIYEATIPRLSKILVKSGFISPDLLCIATPSALSALDTCYPKTTFYHCTGEFWRMPNVNAAIKASHEEIIERSNVVIVPNKEAKADIVELYAIQPKRVKVIEHGSDLSLINSRAKEPRHGVSSVGIPQTTDLCLLRKIAEHLGSHELKIIGPFKRRDRLLFKDIKNVRFYGLLEHDEAMIVLNRSRVGLICYSERVLRYGYGGMKLYDYAAASLPIVSVPLPSYASINHPPVRLARSPSEFVEEIRYCLENWNALSRLSQEFAIRSSWEKRYQEFYKIVINNLNDEE